jgi:hypothetical protein
MGEYQEAKRSEAEIIEMYKEAAARQYFAIKEQSMFELAPDNGRERERQKRMKGSHPQMLIMDEVPDEAYDCRTPRRTVPSMHAESRAADLTVNSQPYFIAADVGEPVMDDDGYTTDELKYDDEVRDISELPSWNS